MFNNKGKENLILLDLFSGIGGFHAGLRDAGFKFSQVYFSEIDKHAIANYKYNFKHATYIGRVENHIEAGIIRPNIITFGSPCQDFSLAGKRKGLLGTRSGLIQEAITTVSHYRPDIFIWENVKGAFSSNNSEDFWSIIQAFANIRGYAIEWQLVNTSWVLPQNRERIYLIGYLAESFRDWTPIFPITQNDSVSTITRRTDARSSQTSFCRTIRPGYGNKADNTYIRTSVTPTQTCAVLSPSRQNKRQNGRRFKSSNEVFFTLTSQDRHGIYNGNNIRRITEIECERLQGFPDNWTKYGIYDGVKKELSATQRYKLCGNAATSSIVELIGSKIKKNL